MSFYNMIAEKKEAVEIDLKSARLFSQEIHSAINIIVDSSLAQLIEFYTVEELTDDILLTEASSIAEQTCKELVTYAKEEMNEEVLKNIGDAISIMIVMRYINEIEPTRINKG